MEDEINESFMRILITDDDLIKIKSILEAVNDVSKNFIVENALYGKDALRLMKDNKYDLLILDLNLPFAENEIPSEDGGRKVVSEIYRTKKKIYLPNYIVGLTQFEAFVNGYFNVWNVFHYKSNNDDWKINLKKLLTHIEFAKTQNEIIRQNQNRIIVEGETDYYYLNRALELYYPHLKEKINIYYSKNAGVNWVVNQSLMWMYSYHKSNDGIDLIALALLDNDESGVKGHNQIKDLFKSDKQRDILKVFLLKEKWSENVLKFYKIGCKVEFEIESLFDLEHFEFAENKGWLNTQNPKLLSTPKDWDSLNENLSEFLINKGLDNDDLLFLGSIYRQKKSKFCQYILKCENPDHVFRNFKPLLDEVLKKIKVLE